MKQNACFRVELVCGSLALLLPRTDRSEGRLGQFEETVPLERPNRMNRTKRESEVDPGASLLPEPRPNAGLRLKFHNVPLQTILNYLHETTELPIAVECNVEIERTMDLWDDELVNKEQAIHLLKQALNERGYTAIHRRGTLAILRRQDAKKHCIPLPMPVYSTAT